MSRKLIIVTGVFLTLALILSQFSLVSFAEQSESSSQVQVEIEGEVTIEEMPIGEVTKIDKNSVIVDDNGEITIDPNALEKLEEGEHTVVVEHNGGIYSSQVIVENGVPLATAPFSILNAWSLFNLIAAALIVCATFFVGFAPQQKFDLDISEEKIRQVKTLRVNVICAMILGSLLIVSLLLVTQDYSQPMTIFDDYSVIFAVLTFLAVVTVSESNKKIEKQSESDNDYT